MSAPDSAAALAADAPWPELDRRFLQKDRRAPPPFPLDVIPAAWRPWIDGHARSSTCADYIALGLLAAVSAVCGLRVVIDVTPHWRAPLVLWQVPTSPASILALSPTTVDPGCVRRQRVRTPFLSRFRSAFSRLSQGSTVAKCRGDGLLASSPSETPIKNGENGRYGQKPSRCALALDVPVSDVAENIEGRGEGVGDSGTPRRKPPSCWILAVPQPGTVWDG